MAGEQFDRMWLVFKRIWDRIEENEGRVTCRSCGKPLGDTPQPIFFDHLLEKSKYPELRLVEDNIYVVCSTCHGKKNNGYPTAKHKEAIKRAENQFL